MQINNLNKNFTCKKLDNLHVIWGTHLRDSLLRSLDFEELWKMHPTDFHEIKIHGKLVKTPRWQQAFGKDYHYTGHLNKALAIPGSLNPVIDWCKKTIDSQLNGILVNWYDGKQRHYIGRHRDSPVNKIPGTPIVTISLGEERIFRMRPWKGTGSKDFLVANGSVLIIPHETNQTWTHEVPHFTKFKGRRISITLRAFFSD